MIKLLVRTFIKDYKNVADKKVRESYTVLGGIIGLVCNFLLFLLKLLIGTAINSIAVIGDAFNNLSDTGSSFVAIIGAKLSNKKPDAEHPFGHGRIEYISSLIVSFLIMMVGLKLFKSSIEKIKNPEAVYFNIILTVILLVSVLVKLWMFLYYKYLGQQINSSVLLANSKDSINDVFSTSAVITATVIGSFTKLPIDGIIGIIVSVIIIFNGFSIAKKTVGLLLGSAPDKETVKKIYDILTNAEDIIGIHDLIVHDYGPGRIFASVHAEIPDDADIVKVHETIDALEKKIENELGIEIVIHMDPISVNNEKATELKSMVEEIVKEENPAFSIHDFRITDGADHINIIFDLVVDFNTTPKEKEKALNNIKRKIEEKYDRCSAVIKAENSYVEHQTNEMMENLKS